MKHIALLLTSAVFTGLGSGVALADCHDTSASAGANMETTGSVSGTDATTQGKVLAKDGTLAPLEVPNETAGVTETQSGTVTNFEEAANATDSDATALGGASASGSEVSAAVDPNRPAGVSGDDTQAALGSPEGAGFEQPAGAAGNDPGAADMGADFPVGENEVVKNGQTMPLADDQGGGDEQIAMSAQDVESQQAGGQTAAARAYDDCE